jgi:MarR family transcriptional regulator, lower aerobic nicotinate degradation pathway regulator
MRATDPCSSTPPTPHRLSGTTVWLLGRASLRAHQALQERFAEHGIRKWHYAVLAAVEEGGPATQAEIGRRLDLDRSDLVGVLNDLEAARYVHRAPDPANRRRNRVTLTEAGRAALAEFDTYVVATDDELLASLSPAERAQLVGLLERLVYSGLPR